jgi:hypothetical protein
MLMLSAAAGIYKFMSYSVSQRRKAVGIRIACGADCRDVLGLIKRDVPIGDSWLCVGMGWRVHSRSSGNSYSVALAGTTSSQSLDSLSPAAFILSSLFRFGIAICASFAPRALLAPRALILWARNHEPF